MCSDRDPSMGPWCLMNKICPNKHQQDGGGHRQDSLAAPPAGPPLMFSLATMVVAAELAGNTPRGPAINIFFNLDGGHCWAHR
jgi:hypothetical protein